jgi:protein arginine kinase
MTDPVALAAGLTVSRNEAVLPFPHSADDEALQAFRDRVEEVLSHRGSPGEWEVFDMDLLSPVRRAYLVEKGLMTPAFSRGTGTARAFGLFQGGKAALEINGADHLRMLGSVPADRLSEAWATLDSIDDMLESEIAYAFDERWGYLTAHAADSGTGLHAYVTVHVPALMITGRLGQAAASIAEEGLALTPLWNGAGGVFQVFNRQSLGTSEGRITEAVSHACGTLVEQERAMRARFLSENPVVVRDHIGRALGVAQHAWSVSTPEALTVVSSIQVGVAMGLVTGPGCDVGSTLSLMRRVQPGHMVIDELGPGSADLDDPLIDEARARMLRRIFAEARVVE